MHSYTDNRGNKHSISDEELELAVDAKIELQKATNGTCNWGTLCKKLRDSGIDAQRCENFRVLVREFQRSIGKLKPVAKYADLVVSSRLKSLKNEVGELNLAKRELQNLKRDFGKLKRYVTDAELNKQEIYNLAQNNVHVDVVQREHVDYHPTPRTHSLLVSLSDLHVGAVTNLPNSTYNSKKAFDYLYQYANIVVDMIDREAPKEVYIANLGDMIEGSFMRFNQSFDIDLNQSEQQSKAIEYITTFIKLIYEHTSNQGVELYYTGIAGNHDRSNGNKKNNIEGDSFITVLNTVINLMSKQMVGFNYLEPDSETRTKLHIRNHWIKLVHGDFDNLNKASVLSNLSQLDGIHYDALVGGHKHSLMIKENNGLIVQSGSIVGNTNYSSDLAVSASRSQVILRIDESGIVPMPIALNIPRIK